MKQRTRQNLITTILTLILVIIIVLISLFSIAEMEQVMYIQCCEDSGGEILVTALDCDHAPSDCAYCSVKLNWSKCNYNLTN